MKYVNADTFDITWYWENAALTLSESEADQTINIGSRAFIASFFLKGNGPSNGFIMDLSNYAPYVAANYTNRTWRELVGQTGKIGGGKASFVSSVSKKMMGDGLCLGFGLFPQYHGEADNHTANSLSSTLPSGVRALNRCLPVPAAAEWCLFRDNFREFDFDVIRTNQAEGRYQTQDLRIDCTDEIMFILKLNNGKDSIPLNNGMNALLTLTSSQKPLTTPVRGLKGLNLVPLNVTLQGKPANDGPFSGKGVLLIEYP
ncbi:hypothetical protein AAF463_24495 (plasmid) [Pantoea sp. BJ2]|uniref:Uncharacterized protein n=1 Tax=Pantoea sp. BJ2 TaxID=3141322 RepID=A0AAU7U3Q1_9GAMM